MPASADSSGEMTRVLVNVNRDDLTPTAAPHPTAQPRSKRTSARCLAESSSSEAYYVIVFGSQTTLNWPKFSHTFATFVKTVPKCGSGADQAVHGHTISWLPKTLDIVVLRPRPEPGINLDLQSTLRWALSVKARIFRWGPFQIKQELYERALHQITRLQNGAIAYKAVDWRFRPRTASNCIHALSDLDMDRGMLSTGIQRGAQASSLVSRHFLPWILEPATTHEWLNERLGLGGYPLIARELGLQSSRQKVRMRGRLLAGIHSFLSAAPGLPSRPACCKS